MIEAILRAQFQSMRLSRAGGGRRGALFSAVTAGVWYGFWCVLAVSAFDFTAHTFGEPLELALRGSLMLAFLYWQVMPVLTASMGAGLDMRKLLPYPIPHVRLFQVEVLLRVLSGSEMLILLAGATAGLLANPRIGGWSAALRIVPAVLLFCAFNVLLSSGLRSLLVRFLGRGRIREVLVLLLLVGLTLPRFFAGPGSGIDRLRAIASTRRDGTPWAAAAHAFLGEGTIPWLLILCAWTVVAGCFGRWQFERGLRYDSASVRASLPRVGSPVQTWIERFYHFPSLLWRDPLAAIVEKELRTLGRSPRFRMVFVMGFSFGLLVWLPMLVGRYADPSSAPARHFLVVVCIYAMTLLGQVSYWNSFGFDRSAAQIFYFAPQPIVRTLVAKNVASLIFIYLEAGLVTSVALVLRVGVGPAQICEAMLVLAVCSLYMLGLGNISSVQYPRALDPEQVSQGGASSRFQALTFLLYPFAMLPVFFAYLARYLLSSDLAFWLLMAAAALVGGSLYWIATESAVSAAVRRREQILQELSKSEGPVVAN